MSKNIQEIVDTSGDQCNQVKEIVQRLYEMKLESHLAMDNLTGGYLNEYDSNGELIGTGFDPEEEKVRFNLALDVFNEQRQKLQNIYNDPWQNPIFALSARVNELYMLRGAHMEFLGSAVFLPGDDKFYDEYPQYFSDLEEESPNQSTALSEVLDQQDLNYNRYQYNPSDIYSSIEKFGLRPMLQRDLGVDIQDLSDKSGELFMSFLLNGSNEVYDRLCRAIYNTPIDDRSDFVQSFIALEFGDDFGEYLLDLAERAYAEEQRNIFLEVSRNINNIRSHGEVIAEQISQGDVVLEKDLRVAFIKRTTELLSLASQEGLIGVRPVLRDLAMAMREIHDSIIGDTFTVHQATGTWGTLQAENHKVTITARPSGDNARLGFTVRGFGERGKDRLNIRLDYEDGGLSLDIGSIAKSGVNVSDTARMVGETLARGELALSKYRAEKSIQSGVTQQEIILNGNHVREAFANLGTLEPSEFSSIVNQFLYSLKVSDSSKEQEKAA